MDWVKLLLLNTPETTLSVDAFPEVAGQLSVGFRCLNLFSFAYSRNTLKHTMSSNNMADPRRQNKILRWAFKSVNKFLRYRIELTAS